MPSNKLRHKIEENLSLLKTKLPQASTLSQDYREALADAIKKDFTPYHVAESLDPDTIGMISYYAEQQGLDIVLAELPEVIHKLYIANSMTRLQLDQMLSLSARECVYNPDLKPNTPWNMSSKIFPDIVTKYSDDYTAAVIDRVVDRGYKRLLVLQGGIQSMTTPHYLMSKINPAGIVDTLTPPPWKISIVEDYFLEDIVEKFAILDVMQHGLNLFKDFDRLSFKSTYGIISKFADETMSLKQHDEIRYVHVKLLKKYFERTLEQSRRAQEELRKLYLSKATN